MPPEYPAVPSAASQPQPGLRPSAETTIASPPEEAAPAGAGVDGNARLTSVTGVLLLALLALEGVSILSVRQMITLHVFVGVLLLGPVLLKSGSTVYRFPRYYTGAAAYRAKGPPHLLLRILGPILIVSSLSVLGTGIALLGVEPSRSDALLTAHQVSFAVWFAVTTVHVLGHLYAAVRSSWAELRRPPNTLAARRRVRFALIAVALLLGVGAAAALLPSAAPWTNNTSAHHHQPHE